VAEFGLSGVASAMMQSVELAIIDFVRDLSGPAGQEEEEGEQASAVEGNSHPELNEDERAFLSEPLGQARVTAPVVTEREPTPTAAAPVEPEPIAAVMTAPADAPEEMADIPPVATMPAGGIANILDPEERAALNVSLGSATMPAHSAAAMPALRPVDAAIGNGDRRHLWHAARQSIVDLIPASILLDAQPPHDEASLLAVDSTGRLHLWLLANPAEPTGWSSLWQWAREHRQLIALTRRDLSIDPVAEVGIHLIIPPSAERTLIRSAPNNVAFYRMHAIRWHDRHGLVVIPAG
jgi:hypothetical protein